VHFCRHAEHCIDIVLLVSRTISKQL